ncbi:type IVB secretion system apparatus protein IcmL/DotI [Cereibacter sphaeroides]|uniref:type IVB secretion system apparatus protein IcmL/DotI n=1 Tax=Cereibacter sphaeroides TaxID=1063 RepID=UPI001F224B91|nr:type IVB secretion system apparatus protein IcmL/DotI [Cereibacter sphaeroides]MCE6959652.1 type IVB secretion system apparatus protein IcmL/DotI [Cereibacter sphaeroides]
MKNRSGASETALARHETYRAALYRMTIISGIMAATSFLGVASAWWAFSQVPEPRYFVAREDGGIIPLVPVDQPYLSDGAITNFAVEAITQGLTMNFATWRKDLAASSEYFDRPDGWNNFLEALEGSGVLEFVRNRRLISTAVANGATIVQSGADESGRYRWVVQVPITLTYQSSSEQNSEDHLAEIEIVRLPTWKTSRGVGITRVLVK